MNKEVREDGSVNHGEENQESKGVEFGSKEPISIDISLPLNEQPKEVQDLIFSKGFDNIEDFIKSLNEQITNEPLEAGPNTNAHLEGENARQMTDAEREAIYGGEESEKSRTKEDMVQEATAWLKGFREILDMNSKLMKVFSCNGSNELLRAKHWCGKLLGSLGNAYPYPAADKVSDIPKTVDTANEKSFVEAKRQLELMDELARVNYFRADAKNLINSIEIFSKHNQVLRSEFDGLFLTQVYLKINEASFELGEQLGTIRERGY